MSSAVFDILERSPAAVISVRMRTNGGPLRATFPPVAVKKPSASLLPYHRQLTWNENDCLETEPI